MVDRYRYWTIEAIVADLDTRRHDFHVAIENWQHDFNIGTIVRTANAFLAREVHIVGKRRWNRRGAMVTDRYQHVRHHATRRGPRRAPPRAGGAADGRRQPAGLGAPRDLGDAAVGVLALRAGGPGTLGRRRGRSATAPSRSRSSAPPGRSTPRRRRRSRCTPGSRRYADLGVGLAGVTPARGSGEPVEAPDEPVAARQAARLGAARSRRPSRSAACSGCAPGRCTPRCPGRCRRPPGRPRRPGRRAGSSTRCPAPLLVLADPQLLGHALAEQRLACRERDQLRAAAGQDVTAHPAGSALELRPGRA